MFNIWKKKLYIDEKTRREKFLIQISPAWKCFKKAFLLTIIVNEIAENGYQFPRVSFVRAENK